jgi:hypothetical protein
MTTSNKIDELKYVLSFDYCFSVDRIGRGGGLAFLWKKSINCNITNYSTNHIDIEVIDAIKGKWRLTGFYGMPEGGKAKRVLESTAKIITNVIVTMVHNGGLQ